MRNYLCITCLLQSVTVYFSKHSLVKVTPSTQLAMLLLERTQSLTLISRPMTDMFTLHDVTTRWRHTQSAGQISLHLEHVLFKVHTLKNNYYLHTILFFNLFLTSWKKKPTSLKLYSVQFYVRCVFFFCELVALKYAKK